MSTPFIGEIRLVGFNFNPDGWHICDGSLLPISEYEPLYVLIGTTYGGDGTSTFALPDLRGRVPVHQGTGAGLQTYVMGEQGGQTGVTLNPSQLPSHTHPVSATSSPGSSGTPTNSFFGPTPESVFTATGNAVAMGSIVGLTGGGQPHDNQQPSLAVNYVIALLGVFPTQG